MKENLRRLSWLVKLFGYKTFYAVRADGYFVTAQGNFNPEIMIKAKVLKFYQSVGPTGYIELTRDNYKIILT